ncbi:uncharacterized protein LOC110703270 [Chenopodium quinoa]|uniref:uncharacterized protein LOC110703270 n=1 Tax=Chenopodium quinoa TaxID=63459 RepID=UPI000B770DA3|nr:uncharacterized protein LOC110703270 [Chenopodium quinoa]
MAASSLGISNTQILSSKLNYRSSLSLTSFPRVIRAGSRPKSWKQSGLKMSQTSHKELIICRAQASLTTESEPATSTLEEGEEQTNLSGPVSQLIPNSDEVKLLLTEICDTTSIAEFELKLNGFHLHVTRELSKAVDLPPLPPSGSASMSSNTAVEAPSLNGPVSPLSLAIAKAEPLDIVADTLLERAANEGLVIIQSPKVGFFRRSRTIKGKRAPPACKEKQVVKEGQVICYIEQLGGEIPVESDISGEVTKILCKDGEPVGYGDAIIAILPSFPGIKKLQLEG